MNYIPYYKSNLRLAVPVIISQVGTMSVQLVDTIMVGHLGATELAAVAFANTLAWPILFFGQATAMGLTPLVGRSNAMGNRSRTVSLLGNSMSVNVVLAIVMMVIMSGMAMTMTHMGQDASILPIAQKYIVYQILSCLPMMLFATGKQFLEGLGNTTYAMMITISGNVVNVILNFCLIYGLWIFPEMGAVGAGTSTFISRVLMTTAFGVLVFRKSKYREYLVDFSRDMLTVFRVRRLLNVGIPIAMQTFIETAALSLMALAVGLFGATNLAAHQIAFNIPSLCFMFITGLASATTIKVSQDYGLRLYDSMKHSLYASVHLIVAFTIFTSILIAVFARPIASIFTTDPEVINVAVGFLLLGAVFQIPDGVQGVVLGGLRGTLEVKKPMYFAIGVYVLIALPLGYLLSFQFGLGAKGTWVAFIISLTLLSVLYSIEFRQVLKKLVTSGKVEQ